MTTKKTTTNKPVARREPSLPDLLDEPFFGLRWSPFRMMQDNGWLFPRWWPRWMEEDLAGEAEWLPAIDIHQKNGTLVAKVELPGIDPKQIEVTVEDGVLTIQGSKDEQKKEETGEVVRRERSWGRFVRQFTLPAGADADKLQAEYENGVLTITVPYAGKKPGKKIEVKTK